MKNKINSFLIKKLLVTQKSNDAENKLNKMTIVADHSVTKFDVIAFFTALSVSINFVNSINIKSEKRVFKGKSYNAKSLKKFIVTFNKGENVKKIIDNVINLQLSANKI
jgi:ribosomal protein L23